MFRTKFFRFFGRFSHPVLILVVAISLFSCQGASKGKGKKGVTRQKTKTARDSSLANPMFRNLVKPVQRHDGKIPTH